MEEMPQKFRLKHHKSYYQTTAKTPDKTPQKFRLRIGIPRISRTFGKEIEQMTIWIILKELQIGC